MAVVFQITAHVEGPPNAEEIVVEVVGNDTGNLEYNFPKGSRFPVKAGLFLSFSDGSAFSFRHVQNSSEDVWVGYREMNGQADVDVEILPNGNTKFWIEGEIVWVAQSINWRHVELVRQR